MLHEELMEIREPILRKVQDHPFWSGLRDGSLPAESLAYFVRQDTGFLLPAYARALARCAASAPDDADASLLGQSVVGTLTARDELRQAYDELAPELDLPPIDDRLPVGPGTHGHASFFTAASARSFYAGLGALLPMVWFNAEVSDGLTANAVPGTRYVPWIRRYHPGPSYQYAVRAFLDMVDRAAETGSPDERRVLIEQFSISIRYEWAFADNCLARSSWPVCRGGAAQKDATERGA